jgi:hypothetical protein
MRDKDLTWAEWAESFQIFAKHSQGKKRLVARKEEILAGPDPKEVSPEDCARLEEIGWDNIGFCFRMFTA